MMCLRVAPVDLTDERRHRRRLSRAGGAANEDEAAAERRQRRDLRRQGELRQPRYASGQCPNGGGGAAAFAVQVDAKAAELREAQRRIGDARLLDIVRAACGGRSGTTSLFDVGPVEHGAFQPHDGAIDADAGALPATSSRSLPRRRTTSASSGSNRSARELLLAGRPARRTRSAPR